MNFASANDPIEGLLTEAEIKTIILAVLEGHKGATETDVSLALKWAHQVRTDELLLEMVLKEKLVISNCKSDKEIDLTFKAKDTPNGS